MGFESVVFMDALILLLLSSWCLLYVVRGDPILKADEERGYPKRGLYVQGFVYWLCFICIFFAGFALYASFTD